MYKKTGNYMDTRLDKNNWNQKSAHHEAHDGN